MLAVASPSLRAVCGVGGWEGLIWHPALSDNWKVPVLARPSVPIRLAPGRLLPTPEGPQLSTVRVRSLAGRGRQRLVLPLFIPISFSALVLWISCQVHEKFAVQPRRGCFVARRWAGKVDVCSVSFPQSVCLLKWGPWLPFPPIPATIFLALICKSTARAGQLSCNLGSSAHHPL